MERITGKEEEIMEFFWKEGPLFVKQIMEYYNEPRPHINTLSTIVRNLEEKGYLGHRAYGNSYQYYPVVSKDEFKKKTLRNVISKYFNNSYLDVVSAFVNEEDISIDELKKLIRAAKNTKR
jgi:predicted transcriptional regulator